MAAALARPLAVRARLSRASAAGLARAMAMLPLSGLVAAMLLSPERPRASAGPDPRGPHRTLQTAAGARIAWWSITPPGTARRTPVVFLHGGPGSFTRNRDFDVAHGRVAAMVLDPPGDFPGKPLPSITREPTPGVTGHLSIAPAVLIRGGSDYIPRATTARLMKEYPAAQRVDVPDRGHALYGNDDQEFGHEKMKLDRSWTSRNSCISR